MRRPAAASRAWRPVAPARATPLFLEEREVGARHHPPERGAAGVLGIERLPHTRRPMAGTAPLGRFTLQRGWGTRVVPETPRGGPLRLQEPEWPRPPAGQHGGGSLTAGDRVHAPRSDSHSPRP